MNTMGTMNKSLPSYVKSYPVRLDGRRRPTLPSALLEEAGIMAGSQELVARVDGPGRVVLEDPTALLGALQKSVAAHKRERHIRGSLVDRLIEDRRDDKSLK
jgi:hypothetical protein